MRLCVVNRPAVSLFVEDGHEDFTHRTIETKRIA